MDNHLISPSLSGVWVQARSGNGLETLTSPALRSSSLKERLSQWKLAREKLLCTSRNQSHDMKACGTSKEVEIEDLGVDTEFRLPLSRKVKIASSKINPYRVTILLRVVILAFYFRDRLLNPVKDAYGLWLASVICEVWFAVSWFFEQLINLKPVDRKTYPERLCLRYNQWEKESLLPCIDVFVATADPNTEKPLVTANTLLSILSVDYPPHKLSCYVSDDGAALLTLETLSKTCEFARKWVPFCKKFEIEPRSPDCYFSRKVDFLKYSIFPTFTKERRAIKRQYEEFKIMINELVLKYQKIPSDGQTLRNGTPWPGNNSQDHPGMIQILTGIHGPHGSDEQGVPQLVYVSRERRPGFQHNNKAGATNALLRVSALLSNAPYILNVDYNHYVNNSKVLLEAMCFMLDRLTMNRVSYVQFPMRFDGIDPRDRYATNTTVFYDINLKGLDGIQGPFYIGAGCIFNRKALYGFDPPSDQDWPRMYTPSPANCEEHECLVLGVDETANADKKEFPSEFRSLESWFGQSTSFLASSPVRDVRFSCSASPEELLKEAICVISCEYEDNTAWGREVGWKYGPLTMDLLMGLKMHIRGWRSVYYVPSMPAFRGPAPTNLSDRLRQVFQLALASIHLLLSRHCPILYGRRGGKLKLLQRIAYINATVYPLNSIPLLIYCTLPAVCLFTGRFIMPLESDATSTWLPLLLLSVLATRLIESKWSGVRFQEWWGHEQFWVIAGVSSHFCAVCVGFAKVALGKCGMSTTPRSKCRHSQDDDDNGNLNYFYSSSSNVEFYAFNKWTLLLIMPTTLIFINLWAVVAGVSFALSRGYVSWVSLSQKLFFACLVIIHLYPFLKGPFGRQHRIPTVIIVWSFLLASLFAVVWIRQNPFSFKYHGPDSKQCGINC